MDRLSEDKRTLLAKRRDGFEQFIAERMPVLSEFMASLELPEPEFVLVDAESFLAPLDQWLAKQTIDKVDRDWLLTRVGYYVGEYLVQQLAGCWLLCEAPDSPLFGHYVVGQFGKVDNPRALADPFEAATVLVDQPRGRSLTAVIEQVVREIQQA
jgi:hypothetical protein